MYIEMYLVSDTGIVLKSEHGEISIQTPPYLLSITVGQARDLVKFLNLVINQHDKTFNA
jgi:hypothetical protein